MRTSYPKICIVTPSYNQERFIEQAIRSVVDQRYPNLEYIIIDGGSADGTTDIIRRYEEHLSYWVTEPDKGQYDALNKGFSKSSGEIMAWLNSDDKYTPWAFELVADLFSKFPEIEWLNTLHPLNWGEKEYAVASPFGGGANARSFFKGGNLPTGKWHARTFLQQESMFWRRSLWERAGARLDSSLRLAADFELWFRFFHHADLYSVDAPLGGFRFHPEQQTASRLKDYVLEATHVLERSRCAPYGRLETAIRQAIWYAFGNRSLRPLPRFLSNVLSRTGLLYPAKTCVFVRERMEWEIVTDYVV